MGSFNAISDLFKLENIVELGGITYSKNILIDTLRDVFSQDRQYKYVADVYGFPLTPSELGLSSAAGLDNTETTRIYIGPSYRQDVKFNPSLIIRNTGSRYVPVSFNQDMLSVQNRVELLTDEYGNQTQLYAPAYHLRVGAYDQNIECKIIAESQVDREEIADICQTVLMSTRRLDLQNAGLFIKTLSTGGEQEQPYANDYLYSVAINLECRTEFRIKIPISSLCERIGLCLAFGTIDGEISDALSVNEQLNQENIL